MKRLAGVLLACASIACSEQLASPSECPGNCPSDNLRVVDTIIGANRDSTYTGFLQAGQGSRLLASNGFLGEALIPAARFAPAVDSIAVGDTVRAAVLDSVILSVALAARDTTINNLALQFYRLPETLALDSSTTWAEVDGELTPDNLIGAVAIPDSLRSGALRLVLSGSDLSKVAFPSNSDRMLRLAYRLVSPSPTAILLTSSSTGSGPAFLSWLRAVLPDTTVQRGVPRIALFDAFFDATPESSQPPDLLTIGGYPSSRIILRFNIPSAITDSGQVVKATLELTPTEPIRGLSGDTAFIDVRGVFTDLGPKSPRIATAPVLVRTQILVAGSTSPVSLDVTPIVSLWRAGTGVPSVLIATVMPEAATLGLARFGSSRTAGFEPRLRLTYAAPYPFEVQ